MSSVIILGVQMMAIARAALIAFANSNLPRLWAALGTSSWHPVIYMNIINRIDR